MRSSEAGQGRETKLCKCVRVEPVIWGERIVDLDTGSGLRLGVRVVVMRVVQRLPGNASNVPAEGEQECIDGLKFLWRPNIERH
jgi:hypothetical protein